MRRAPEPGARANRCAFMFGCVVLALALLAVPTLAAEQRGVASWYGEAFQGKTTASGARFDKDDLTAAHPSLPLGTTVEVTNPENGRSVEVEINDRGPQAPDRDIDLSERAAEAIGIKEEGVAPVVITVPGAAEAD
jgi:rare lipoprotein A